MSVNAADCSLASARDTGRTLVLGEALRFSVLCCLATIGAGWICAAKAGLGPVPIAGAALCQAAFLAFALTRLRHGAAPQRLGRANRITILRSSFVALLAALAVDPPTGPRVLWSLVAFAIIALVLDGLDGAAARRDGNESPFGAWLDQEIDALFVLVLAVFVFRSGEAGAWILAAGAWRYVYLGLRAAFPRLRRDLPFSSRRRAVCVVQLAVLVGCVAPIIEPPFSTVLAALSLAALSLSFLVDIAHLWRSASIDAPAVRP